jgi:hypothetical protein
MRKGQASPWPIRAKDVGCGNRRPVQTLLSTSVETLRLTAANMSGERISFGSKMGLWDWSAEVDFCQHLETWPLPVQKW